MSGGELGPETRETARKLEEIADRLGKLQAQLDEREPLYDRQQRERQPDDAASEPGPGDDPHAA